MNTNARCVIQALFAAACLWAAGAATAHAQDAPIRIAGSSFIATSMVAPHMKDIEEVAGARVEIISTDSRAGLHALLRGDADVAMISAPLRAVAAGDDALGAAVSDGRFRAQLLGAGALEIAVNGRLAIPPLDREALMKIFTGEVRRWSELEGPDLPILIIAPPEGEGPRVSLKRYVLRGRPLADRVLVLDKATSIVRAIDSRVNAIGVVDADSLADAQHAAPIDLGRRISQPMFLVSLKETSEPVDRLMARTVDVF